MLVQVWPRTNTSSSIGRRPGLVNGAWKIYSTNTGGRWAIIGDVSHLRPDLKDIWSWLISMHCLVFSRRHLKNIHDYVVCVKMTFWRVRIAAIIEEVEFLCFFQFSSRFYCDSFQHTFGVLQQNEFVESCNHLQLYFSCTCSKDAHKFFIFLLCISAVWLMDLPPCCCYILVNCIACTQLVELHLLWEFCSLCSCSHSISSAARCFILS